MLRAVNSHNVAQFLKNMIDTDIKKNITNIHNKVLEPDKTIKASVFSLHNFI